MKRLLAGVLCLAVLLCLWACGGQQSEPPQGSPSFCVGYAKADITPEGNAPLSGFGDDAQRIAAKVLDRLYATCVAFRDTQGQILLMINMDLINSEPAITNNVRQLISEATGVPFNRVMMSASHTHSGVSHLEIQNPALLVHKEEYRERCVQIAKDAIADLKPARMYGTFTRPEGLNFVRHYVLQDGTYQAYKLGELDQSLIYGHLWKADNLMQLIKFTREGGKDVVLINWQAHYAGATKIDYNGISADYPGVMRAAVEEALGCEAAFVLGGSGDLTSNSRLNSDEEDGTYIEKGQKLAAAAIAAAENFVPLETGEIQMQERKLTVEGNARENILYTFGFGDFGIAFAPWEIFDTNAIGVREDSQYTYTFYASCANTAGMNGYLARDFSFTYYCYEAETAQYPRGTAELVQQNLTEMLQACFAASGQTPKERAAGYLSSPFTPVTDGKTYINPSVGDPTAIREGKNGHYQFLLLEGTTIKSFLAVDRNVAEQINAKESMKLYLDERNIIVAVE